jgi:hypothetical protein
MFCCSKSAIVAALIIPRSATTQTLLMPKRVRKRATTRLPGDYGNSSRQNPISTSSKSKLKCSCRAVGTIKDEFLSKVILFSDRSLRRR